MERHVLASFAYPFRGRRRAARWLVGVVAMLLFPVSFLLVFGYAVCCVRSAAADPEAGPPAFRVRGRLLWDGWWAALQAAVLTVPFAALAWLIGAVLVRVWHPMHDSFLDPAIGGVVAILAAALPWGAVLLVVVPPTLARFAVSGRPRDLSSAAAIVACVRERYVAWNLVLVAITTAWALATLGLVVAGVGFAAGAFYAILVSAHACAALGPDRSPG